MKQQLRSQLLNNYIEISAHQSFKCFSVEQADEQNLVLSEKARLHLEKYNFPVEMMVALPNGTVVNVLVFLSLLKDMKHPQESKGHVQNYIMSLKPS